MLTIGVDLGGTKIAAGLCDEKGHILRARSVPTGAGRPRAQILADMAALCRALAAEHGVAWQDIAAVGVASPGFINAGQGMVLLAGNLHWTDAPVVAELTPLLDKPVFLENDANIAALGEVAAGSMAGCSHGILLTLGTGVGGGVIIDGQIFSGAHGCGGELGHIIIAWRGEQCACGNQGCLEAYASASALIREGRRAAQANPGGGILSAAGTLDAITAKTVIDCAKAGDADAVRIFDDFIDALAMGVVSLVNVFEPEAVAIGGGVSAAGDFLLDALRARLDERLVTPQGYRPRVVLATLGNDAGIVGAAMLARNKITE